MPTRRHFLRTTATGLTAATLVPHLRAATPTRDALADTYARLDAAADRPVVDVSRLREPLLIERIEFLRQGKTHLVRVRTKNGATGVAIVEAFLTR